MKTIFAAVCLLSLALASPVQAKGCIKGARRRCCRPHGGPWQARRGSGLRGGPS